MDPLSKLVQYALKLADDLRVANESWAYEYGLGPEDINEIEMNYDLDCARIESLHQQVLAQE